MGLRWTPLIASAVVHELLSSTPDIEVPRGTSSLRQGLVVSRHQRVPRGPWKPLQMVRSALPDVLVSTNQIPKSEHDFGLLQLIGLVPTW